MAQFKKPSQYLLLKLWFNEEIMKDRVEKINPYPMDKIKGVYTLKIGHFQCDTSRTRKKEECHFKSVPFCKCAFKWGVRFDGPNFYDTLFTLACGFRKWC